MNELPEYYNKVKVSFKVSSKDDIFEKLHKLLIANYLNTDINNVILELKKIKNKKIEGIINNIRRIKRRVHYYIAINIVYHEMMNISNNYHQIVILENYGGVKNGIKNPKAISNMKFTPYLNLLLIQFQKLQEIVDSIKNEHNEDIKLNEFEMNDEFFNLVSRLKNCNNFKKLRNSAFAHPFKDANKGIIIKPQEVASLIVDSIMEFSQIDEQKIIDFIKHQLQSELNVEIFYKYRLNDNLVYEYHQILASLNSESYFKDKPMILIDAFINYYFSARALKINLVYFINKSGLLKIKSRGLSYSIGSKYSVFFKIIYEYLTYLKEVYFKKTDIFIINNKDSYDQLKLLVNELKGHIDMKTM